MSDELDRPVRSIDSEGPEPDALDRMRRRVAEAEAELRTSPQVVVADVVEVELVGDTPRRRRPRTWPLLVAAAIVAVIAMAGLWAIGDERGSEQLETAGSPEPTTAEAAPQGPRVALDPDATPLTSDASAPIDPGSYRVDSVGTPFTFTLGEPLFVQSNQMGSFVLSDRVSQGPGDRDIVVARFTELSDPTDPTTPIAEADEPWPADDFDGWLDDLGDNATATDRQEVQLGGRDAIRVDLSFSDIDCGFQRLDCIAFATNHFATSLYLNLDTTYRIWFVDQGDQDPIYVIAGTNDDADTGWFDRTDALLSTLALGDPAPNPIIEYPAGGVELDLLGGIRTELSTPTVVFADPRAYTTTIVGTQPGATDFLTNPSDTSGTPLTTTSELRSALEAANIDLRATGSTTIDGLDAQIFDVSGGRNVPTLTFATSDDLGWFAPPRGRIWVVEHPTRGLLIIAAGAWTDLDATFPAIVDQTEAIIDTLEFIEPR